MSGSWKPFWSGPWPLPKATSSGFPIFTPGSPRPRFPVPTGKPLPGHEAKRLLAALERTAGNVREAAKLLGISRGGFYVKLKKLGLNPDEYR